MLHPESLESAASVLEARDEFSWSKQILAFAKDVITSAQVKQYTSGTKTRKKRYVELTKGLEVEYPKRTGIWWTWH